ncbi:isoprenoid synthase domain-containing protein [Lophiotrema nucula]|uniref:geranylgeranyl diphosphate synthase n=1 Tax=Lophiotrema nucula TaxID=690887 RepID=A0A6A5YMU6_9PLEO|nr:isoprenoid synthase domain-containing protein [Lophiotrema nucula]
MDALMPTILLVLVLSVIRHFPYVLTLVQRAVKIGWNNKTLPLRKARDLGCPYEYLLNIYGRNHFKRIITFLKPSLQEEDPKLYNLVLEVLDAVHFGAILVDDIADNSLLRKGEVAAHRIFGSSETINRAYLVIFNVVMKCQRERPELVPSILDCVTEIHQGQDDSLVWRRDGFAFPTEIDTALEAYRGCASLKTGALFRLVGQLITCSHELDDVMSEYGWYCQLQNDCKNVFSSEVVAAKGALAEDLINGEYTYPIIVGLFSSKSARSAITDAFSCRLEHKKLSTSALRRAVVALQSEEVRAVCLEELERVRGQNRHFAELWARQERMSLLSLAR